MKGDPRGLLYDPGHGIQWLYTDRFLFQLNITEGSSESFFKK